MGTDSIQMMGFELGAIPCVGDDAADWVSGKLEGAALRVYRSFDLRSTRALEASYACPYHGTQACDCQMTVLLVYQGHRAPATVVLHGHLGITWMVLAEAPDTGLQARIVEVLAPDRPGAAGGATTETARNKRLREGKDDHL